jgi:outer membrane receptor protein involved in Fe transport
MTFHRSYSRLAACIIAAFSPPLLADGAHEEKTDAIEVIGHYENAVGTSNAASQGYITPKLIENKPLLRPAEVLEYVPGVIVTQHSGEGKANQFFLRGFNLDHGTDFATFVAGTPVNMPSHGHGQGYSDLNFLIPELVSRVDYKKGPYYAQEGDFSSAGAAHFHYFDTLRQGTGSMTLGSFGYKRALVMDSPKVKSGNLLYALELVGNNGPWDNPSRFSKHNAVLRYSQGSASDRHAVTLMAYAGDWNATDQIPARAVSSGQVSRLGTIDPTDGGHSQRYSLSYEHRHSHEDHDYQLNAYVIRYRMRLFSNFTYFMNNAVNGDQFEQIDQRTVMGIAPVWIRSGTMWGRESTFKFGLNLRRDVIGRVGLYSTEARQRLSTTREDNVGQLSTGAYAEHTLQWNDWFRSVLGVRSNHFRFDVTSNIAANSGKASDHITSPKLNLIFGPFAKTEFFVSAGHGFHSNDGRGVTARVDPATLAPISSAPALVRSKGGELGVRTEWVRNLQSSLALWRLNLDSELIFVGDAGTTQATRPSRRNGVEWSNRYRPTNWLIVDADLSASKAQFSNTDPAGDRIPGSIDKVAALGASVDAQGPWSGTMQMRYFGPRPLTANNSARSQSTLLWNARVGYRLDKNLRLTADVLNLFNRRANDIDYFYQSQLRGEAAPVNDTHFHPVEPRSLRLALIGNF